MFQAIGRFATSRLVSLGTGIAIGVVAAPYIKKLAENLRPGVDDIVEDFVGKAEGVFESASDIIASAKEKLNDNEQEHDHSNCDHNHDDVDESSEKDQTH